MSEDCEDTSYSSGRFNLPITVSVKKLKGKKKHLFEAECIEFGLSAQGRTEIQAVEMLREQLGVFIDSCMEEGTLKEVLQIAGFDAFTNYYPCRKTGHCFRVFDKNGKFDPEWNRFYGDEVAFVKVKKKDDEK